jgi:hypothetical protein
MTTDNGAKLFFTIHGVIRAAVARSDHDGVSPQHEVQSSLREHSVHANQIQRNLLQCTTTATTTATAFTGVSIGSSNYQTLRLTEKSIHFRMMQPNFLAANPFIFIWKERLSNGTGGSCMCSTALIEWIKFL